MPFSRGKHRLIFYREKKPCYYVPLEYFRDLTTSPWGRGDRLLLRLGILRITRRANCKVVPIADVDGRPTVKRLRTEREIEKRENYPRNRIFVALVYELVFDYHP